jgi:predicted nicotinamide N-methyase
MAVCRASGVDQPELSRQVFPAHDRACKQVYISSPSGESAAFDIRRHIESRLPLLPVAAVPEIRLHQAQASSGLSRLPSENTPYWAYAWAGGAVLARYILDHPETVAGKRVLDLGTGSGLVAIAAALAGARKVTGADVDPVALEALFLNAAANGVEIGGLLLDVATADPVSADVIVAGDLFYEPGLAQRATSYLDRCAASGAEVLIGDPWRASLPVSRLRRLADCDVADFGDGKGGAPTRAAVFALDEA